MTTPVIELKHAHRSLCSGFVSEDLFRRAFGGGRADISMVARYLKLPVPQPPGAVLVFRRRFLSGGQSRHRRGGARPVAALHRHRHRRAALAASAGRPALHRRRGRPGAGGDAAARGAGRSAGIRSGQPEPVFRSAALHATSLAGEAPGNALLRHFLQHGLRTGCTPNPLPRSRLVCRALRRRAGRAVLGAAPFHHPGRHRGARRRARPSTARCTGRATPTSPIRASRRCGITSSHGRREGRQAAAERRVAAAGPRRGGGGRAAASGRRRRRLQRAFADMRAVVEAGRQQRKDAVQVTPPALAASAAPARDIAGLRFAPRASAAPVHPGAGVQRTDGDGGVPAVDPGGRARRCAFEVVVADDCSTDPDMALLGRVANLVYVRQPANVGFLRNCNAAFRRCRGEYVLLLNNDAQVLPGAIDRLVAVLDADPAVAAAGPKIIYPERPAAGGRLLRAAERRERHGRAVRRPRRGRLLLRPRRDLLLRRGADGPPRAGGRDAVRRGLPPGLLRGRRSVPAPDRRRPPGALCQRRRGGAPPERLDQPRLGHPQAAHHQPQPADA